MSSIEASKKFYENEIAPLIHERFQADFHVLFVAFLYSQVDEVYADGYAK